MNPMLIMVYKMIPILALMLVAYGIWSDRGNGRF